MLKRLLQRPIAFHPIFVEVAGSMNAGIMLSQAYYWTQVLAKTEPERKGWFYKTREEWEEETRLTRREQDTARAILREKPFWTEVRKQIPAKMFFQLDVNKLEEAIQNTVQESSKIGGKRQSITESTTESTSENTPGTEESPVLQDSEPTPENLSENPPSEEELTLLEKIADVSRKYDKRFKPLLDHYRKWNTQLGLPTVIQPRDENNLRQFLKRNRTLILPVLQTTMDNAFQSISNPFGKLKPGFTIGDWVYHYTKYSQGPVLEKKGKTENQKVAEKNNWVYFPETDKYLRARPVPGMKYVREGAYTRLVPDNGK